MSSGKHWGWALPGLLVAAACLAQPPSSSTRVAREQLQKVRKDVTHQQAQANDLKQQIREATKRNAAEQASLDARDREIAKLKAQLAHRKGPAGASSATTKAGGGQ
jgi:peptidoglycan hydrolase CwlO-like protein